MWLRLGRRTPRMEGEAFMPELPPKLPEHKVVPFWTLPDREGQPFNLARRRGRAHMIVLVCGPDTDPLPFLHHLASHTDEFRMLPAQALVVVPSPDRAAPLLLLPFTVLIDAEHVVHDRYLPAGAVAGVFILDRYGTLYHQWVVATAAELPSASDVVDWITAVGMQCSV